MPPSTTQGVSVFDPQPTRPAPVATGSQPLWDLVEKPDAHMQPTIPVQWTLGEAEFTWCERIRDLLPDSDTLPPGADKFTIAEQWAAQLKSIRGAGFEYTWRDPQDRRLDPAWITTRSALVEPNTGRIVAAGHPTHQTLGTSPAYDVGALNGSNGGTWTRAGHDQDLVYPTECLYVGSTRTGVLAPVDSAANLCSVDLDPITGTIAVMEALGSSGCITVFDGATGIRRRLAFIAQISGGETLRFSGDGKWLLLPRQDGAHLCEVATGRIVRLPLKYCCWWPLADSTLLEIVESDGRRVPRLFNLETGTYVHDFPAVWFEGVVTPDADYLLQPEVSPDGTEVLALSPVGVASEHQGEYGVSPHLVRVSLADGRGHLVVAATLDTPFPTERSVSEARWTGTYPYREVVLGAALAGQLQAPVLDDPFLAPDRYSPEAEELLVKSLNRAIALFQDGQDVSHLMPTVVMSLNTAFADPEIWARQSDWLLGLGSTVASMIENKALSGRDAEVWLLFVIAVARLSQGHVDPFGPLRAAWIST